MSLVLIDGAPGPESTVEEPISPKFGCTGYEMLTLFGMSKAEYLKETTRFVLSYKRLEPDEGLQLGVSAVTGLMLAGSGVFNDNMVVIIGTETLTCMGLPHLTMMDFNSLPPLGTVFVPIPHPHREVDFYKVEENLIAVKRLLRNVRIMGYGINSKRTTAA